MIKEIEKLNREIERLMTEKTKADAQKEVWESRLTESINNYNNEYGVNLAGKDLADIKKKLIAETNIVEAKTKEEFELSRKLVNLINEGDIAGAWSVLGVDINKKVNEHPETVQEEVTVQGANDVVEELDDSDFFADTEPVVTPVNNQVNSPKVNKGFAFEEVVEDTAPPNLRVNTKIANTFKTPVFEEEDGDDFIIPNSVEVKNNKKKDTKPDKNSKSTGFYVEEDDDDFGGFGNILAGSKFKV